MSDIVVIGKFAAGKSFASEFFQKMYPEFEYSTDRRGLARAVRRDVHGIGQDHRGMTYGARSIVIGSLDVPDDKLVMRVTDPSILNEVHDEIYAQLGKPLREPKIRIVEVATGNDVEFIGGAVLYQEVRHVFSSLRKTGRVKDIVVVEVDAPFEVRFDRNEKRGSKVDKDAFESFAGDGGEGNMAMAFEYGIRYSKIDNSHNDESRLETELRSVARIIGIEGNALCHHERDYRYF